MNYEQKYKEALEWMRSVYDSLHGATKEDAEHYFPELKESEDERIRKGLINGFKECLEDCQYPKNAVKYWHGVEVDSILAWLEKQGEKKPADKVEPKFNVGDWITDGRLTCKVLGVTSKSYELHLHNDDYCHFETDIQSVDKYYRLWAIQDAKDGDVLATENFIFIFKNIDDGNGVHYYCQYEISKHEDDNQFDIALPQSLMGRVGNSISHYSPATKEQRELLFQKMKEAGYEWDADKKELKKIEPKKLDADKVIEWLKTHGNLVPIVTIKINEVVDKFKKDFGLC